MTDADLRTLVRDIVARQLGGRAGGGAGVEAGAAGATLTRSCAAPPAQWGAAAVSVHVQVAPLSPARHTSHGQFLLAVVAPGEPTPCVIEPAVPCDHCGYCTSLGH